MKGGNTPARNWMAGSQGEGGREDWVIPKQKRAGTSLVPARHHPQGCQLREAPQRHHIWPLMTLLRGTNTHMQLYLASQAISLSLHRISRTEQAASLHSLGGSNTSHSSSSQLKVEQQTQLRQLAHSFKTTPPTWPQGNWWGHIFTTVLCFAYTVFLIFGLTAKS